MFQNKNGLPAMFFNMYHNPLKFMYSEQIK